MDTLQENFIDVTLIQQKLKHTPIFEVFDTLRCCESLMIRNNDDSKSIYYQLLAEKGDVFTWQYVRKGPEFWRILITRINENSNETVGEIAVKDLRKVAVFKKYGIDFCCGGKKTVSEVCEEKNIDLAKVETALQQVEAETKISNISYNDWGIDFLADYIVNTHHIYIRRYLPEILDYSIKVAQVHGKHHSELLEIKALVATLNQELADHIIEEEKVLFPYVKKIVSAENTDQFIDDEGKSLQKLIEELENGHNLMSSCFDEIRELSNNYAVPEDACASYNLLFKMLQEFENDLQLHIHLENNILFPKAVAIAKNLIV